MEICYTKSSDGTSIAYQVLSDAGPFMLFVPGAISNLMLTDVDPASARFWERVARFSRVVRFDKRGTGLSDRAATSATITEQVPDVEAVRAAAGAETVVLHGLSQGAAVALLYAVQYPERVTRLIVTQGLCCDASDPKADPEQARPLVDWDEFFRDLDEDFASFSRRFAEIMAPGLPPEFIDAMALYLRASASPQSLRSLWQGIVGLDLRPVLKEVKAPTLVIHTSGDRHHPVAHGRYLAEHISGARYLEIDSEMHVLPMDGNRVGELVAAIEEFVTGSVQHTAERSFAAILFADIVNSTAEQRARGDRAWRDQLASWEVLMRRIVEQFSGRVVKFQGDGVMAVFSSAGEALRSARAALSAVAGMGLQGRAGVHAGEVYEAGGDFFGTCVNIAARVCECGGRGEVLTTTVVEGLVEGADLRFEDRGEADLKGIGRRRLVLLAPN